MKKIIIATDFSTPAENAARYGVGLAARIGATVVLCHVFKSTTEGFSTTFQQNNAMLLKLAGQLADDEMAGSGKTVEIKCSLEHGETKEVIADLVKMEKADLVIMGFTGAGRMMEWAFGSESQLMIDWADFPLLLVPTGARGGKPCKIVFLSSLATDELEPLQFLCILATQLDGEIIVQHIYNENARQKEEQHDIEQVYFENVSSRLQYDKLIFQKIYHENIRDGIRSVTSDDTVDMVAILHRQHSKAALLFEGSLSHQISRAVQVPLLIFQPSEKIYYL